MISFLNNGWGSVPAGHQIMCEFLRSDHLLKCLLLPRMFLLSLYSTPGKPLTFFLSLFLSVHLSCSPTDILDFMSRLLFCCLYFFFSAFKCCFSLTPEHVTEKKTKCCFSHIIFAVSPFHFHFDAIPPFHPNIYISIGSHFHID